MRQAGRTLTTTDEGALSDCRVLICAGDSKWSAPLRRMLKNRGCAWYRRPYKRHTATRTRSASCDQSRRNASTA
jgi:hypothetical protein